MNPLHALLGLLVFPGLLFALPIGWLMMGTERKLRSRFQGRIGPPLTQPIWDTVKLIAKTPVPRRERHEERVLAALPVVAVGSMFGALALLPVFAHQEGFVGDSILLVSLLELAPLCLVLAGFASRSIYGEVGATREALLSIAATIPMLAALIAMATSCGTLRLPEMVEVTPWPVRVPALLAIALVIPAKLRLNPFSIANAEQEVLAGPLTEVDGRRLALWEIAHALEWVAFAGLIATLAVPVRSQLWWVDAIGFVLACFVFVLLVTTVASATARLKLAQATRWMWRWASVPAVVALAIALLSRHESP